MSVALFAPSLSDAFGDDSSGKTRGGYDLNEFRRRFEFYPLRGVMPLNFLHVSLDCTYSVRICGETL